MSPEVSRFPGPTHTEHTNAPNEKWLLRVPCVSMNHGCPGLQETHHTESPPLPHARAASPQPSPRTRSGTAEADPYSSTQRIVQAKGHCQPNVAPQRLLWPTLTDRLWQRDLGRSGPRLKFWFFTSVPKTKVSKHLFPEPQTLHSSQPPWAVPTPFVVKTGLPQISLSQKGTTLGQCTELRAQCTLSLLSDHRLESMCGLCRGARPHVFRYFSRPLSPLLRVHFLSYFSILFQF